MQTENIPGLFSDNIDLRIKVFLMVLYGNGGKRT